MLKVKAKKQDRLYNQAVEADPAKARIKAIGSELPLSGNSEEKRRGFDSAIFGTSAPISE